MRKTESKSRNLLLSILLFSCPKLETLNEWRWVIYFALTILQRSKGSLQLKEGRVLVAVRKIKRTRIFLQTFGTILSPGGSQ